MASSDIQSQIVQEANAQGVPSSIALAVAQHESSFNPNAVGAAGELGLFQLMPSSFPGQPISDLSSNISIGVSYLKQLYAKYGNWNTALAAYNWGSGNVDSGKSVPVTVLNYVSTVLGIADSNAQNVSTAVAVASPVDSSGDASASLDTSSIFSLDPTVLAPVLLGAAGLAALWWAWD